MLYKLDTKLLKIFQRISDWFQSLLGSNNFLLAKVFLGLSIFLILSAGIQLFYTGIGIVIAFSIFIIVMYMLFTALTWSYIIDAELSCKNNPTLANPNVIRMQFVRIMEVILFVFCSTIFTYAIIGTPDGEIHTLLSMIFFLLQITTHTLSMYFASCTPKPPSGNKVNNPKTSGRFQILIGR